MKWFGIITSIAIGIALLSPISHAASTNRGDPYNYYKSAYFWLGAYLPGWRTVMQRRRPRARAIASIDFPGAMRPRSSA
jgi:hypothetical protein